VKKYCSRNGFTLVELLAVIVILAVILAIAVPGISSVISNSSKSAFESDAIMIIKAIQYKMMADESFDPTQIDETNIESVLGVSDDNYQDIIVSKLRSEYKIRILGKNKWAGYAVYGTKNDMGLSETTETVLSNFFADNSGASEPELSDNMIPVMYYDGNWVKADKNNLVGTYSWYNYTNKQWANAVTVTSSTLETYKNADVGTVVNEADVLTYLVWIPRYKYAIPTGSGARTINIVFENSNASKSIGTAIDTNYLTHPAFTFGKQELNGIWVGKFELTGSISSITIKPNLQALRNQKVSSFFTAIRNMEANGNAYSFSSDEVDTHMMKNDEWGAVAYLSMSAYGLNSEIYKNNSSSFYTGRSGGNVGGSQIKPDGTNEYISTGFYTYDGKCATTTTTVAGIDANCTTIGNTLSDTSLSFNANTSGTIYGVYDMSGGTAEYLMGNYLNYSGYSATYNSGFNGPYGQGGSLTTGESFPENKYFNLYTTSTKTTACNGGICYGQALSETSGWYNDYGNMINANNPWLVRGGGNSTTTWAGIFASFLDYGHATSLIGSRLVVTLAY
jgi:prepilin-type N-terminal cleavage/methylation domain-containing protein